MSERGELYWHGLPIDGMTREQLIEVVWQLMNIVPHPEETEPARAALSISQARGENLPCPFCGSKCDPDGWASTDRVGPACDNCGASADTLEIWNQRWPLAIWTKAEIEDGMRRGNELYDFFKEAERADTAKADGL